MKGTEQPSALSGNENIRGNHRRIAVANATDVTKAVRKQAAKFAALVQVHIHKLESHALAAIIAHERGRVEISQAELHAQLHRWRRLSMPGPGSRLA